MRRREGFTLLEILVALMIGGMVLVGAHRILDALSDSARAAQSRALAMDRRANGEDLLWRLAARLDVATPGAKPFFGTARIAEFSSWCDVPRGWLQLCTVVLAIDTAAAKPALIARFDDSTRVILVRGFERAEFRYLESAENGGTWERVWGRGLTAPLAIAVVVDRDTLIVPVGERG